MWEIDLKVFILKGISLISEKTEGPGCEIYSSPAITKDLFPKEFSEITEEALRFGCLHHRLHGRAGVCLMITDLVVPKAEPEARTQCRVGGLWEAGKEKNPYKKNHQDVGKAS